MEQPKEDQNGKAILLIATILVIAKFFQDIVQEIGIENLVKYSTNITIILFALVLFFLSFIERFKENKISISLRWTGIFLIFLPTLNLNYYSLAKYQTPEEIIVTTIMLISYMIVFTAIIFSFNKAKQTIIINKRIKNEFESKLREIDLNKIYSFQTLEENEEKFEKILLSNPKLTIKNTDNINQIKNSLKKIKANLIQKEKELKIKLKQEKEEETSKEKHEEFLKKQLIEYFKIKRNTKTIPEKLIYTDKKIIKEAIKIFEDEEENKERIKEIKQEAINFILKNESYPSNFNSFQYEKMQIYKETYAEFKKGKLKKSHIKSHSDEPLTKQGFYHAKDLTGKEREKLINEHNYRNISFIFLETGKKGNNLLINNSTRKESDYHYCIKQLVHEVDKEHSTIEYFTDEQRTDVLFKIKNKTLAIEIETGKNKDTQIENKIEWLNKNFNQWIIICSRKNKKKYNKQTDNKKSFCLTVTESYKKINEWLATQ